MFRNIAWCAAVDLDTMMKIMERRKMKNLKFYMELILDIVRVQF